MDNDTQETQPALRDKRGRMLAPLPGEKPFTSVTARTAVQRRWEKFRLASNNRITREAASIDPTVKTPADAFALVATKQYTTLMDSDKPKIADLEKLGNIMTGTAQGERDAQREDAPKNGEISMNAGTLIELVTQLERHKARAIEQARAIDGEAIPDAE